MKNILSIDVEDWHQLTHRMVTGDTLPASHRVIGQLDAFMDLLAPHGVRATFFVLGMVAERHPELVRRIVGGGHELASHGYAHLLAHTLTRDQFRQDTARAKHLLEDIGGTEIIGYRAAQFSIHRKNLWALEVLAELGFTYDSSIFPVRHRRYGIPDWPRHPQRRELPSGARIIELPPSTLLVGNWRMPVAGGGYFRVMPQSLLVRAVRRLNGDGLPLVTYTHPYEFDRQPLRVGDSGEHYGARARLRSSLFNFHQNLGRSTMHAKLSALLQNFEFGTCREYLHANGISES